MTRWITDLLDDAGAWLETAADLLPAGAADREPLEAALALLRERGGRLEAPLFVLLAGGTGAGKSTLLNALAGAEIAAVSAIRPTTDRLTVYHHARDELSVPGALLQIGRTVRHERPELSGKILIDAPDFDSTASQHGDRLRSALDVADLVLVLATPEKYANAALYRLLRAYRTGRAFRFLLNRLDLGIPEAVRRDFQEELERAGFHSAEILTLSARAALAWKLDTPSEAAPAGDFERLERFLAEELDRVRAREIKRQNLDAGVGAALERLGALLPPDLERRLAKWQAGAAEIGAALGRQIAGRVARAIEEDRSLREDLESELALRPSGLLGAYQTVVWTLRRLRGSGSTSGLARRLAQGAAGAVLQRPARPDAPDAPSGLVPPSRAAATALGTADATATRDARSEPTQTRVAPSGSTDTCLPPPRAVGVPFAPVPLVPGGVEAVLPGELQLAAQRAADLGVELGLERTGRALDADLASAICARARRAAAAERAALLAAAREPAPPSAVGWARGALWNLAPTSVLIYTLGRWLWAFATGASLPSGWFTAGFSVALLLLFLTGRLVDALARRRAASLLTHLASAASEAAAAEVTAPLVARVETHARRVHALADELQRLRQQARSLRAP